MIKMISLCLIAAGIALLITAAVIFIRKGLMAVWKDLRTSQQAQVDLAVDSVETDLYYNEILKKRQQEEKQKAEAEKQAFKKNVRKKAIDDSAILYEKEQQEKQHKGEAEPVAFRKSKRVPARETGTGIPEKPKTLEATAPLEEPSIPRQQDKPRQTAGPGGTAPLKTGASDTTPLEELIKADAAHPVLHPTEPLQENAQGGGAKELQPTAPLHQYEKTGILRGGTDELKDITIRESGVSGTEILYETLKKETDILES